MLGILVCREQWERGPAVAVKAASLIFPLDVTPPGTGIRGQDKEPKRVPIQGEGRLWVPGEDGGCSVLPDPRPLASTVPRAFPPQSHVLTCLQPPLPHSVLLEFQHELGNLVRRDHKTNRKCFLFLQSCRKAATVLGQEMKVLEMFF